MTRGTTRPGPHLDRARRHRLPRHPRDPARSRGAARPLRALRAAGRGRRIPRARCGGPHSGPGAHRVAGVRSSHRPRSPDPGRIRHGRPVRGRAGRNRSDPRSRRARAGRAAGCGGRSSLRVVDQELDTRTARPGAPDPAVRSGSAPGALYEPVPDGWAERADLGAGIKLDLGLMAPMIR